MQKTSYNKLVRDKILEIIEKDHKTYTYHIAGDTEYQEALHKKLIEEVHEYIENPCIEEIADILEVVTALCKLQGYEEDDVQKVKREKMESRGAFDRRIVLEEVFSNK